jgi:hypothetical protein
MGIFSWDSPSGTQTWQLKIHYKWKFVSGQIIYKWLISSKPRLITGGYTDLQAI